MSLTDKQIKAIKPEGKAKKYFDGGGMYLDHRQRKQDVAPQIPDQRHRETNQPGPLF